MADPASMAMAGGGMGIAGGIVGAVGSITGGYAQQSMMKYQAGIAQMNKTIALQNAAYERKAGETEAQISGMKTRFQVGETKVAQSGSGLDVNRGSAVGVRRSEQEIGAFNEQMIRANAARKAYGYETQAAGEEAQSRLDLMAGKNAVIAGYFGAASSILGGGASAASKWSQAGQQFGKGFEGTPW